jgi:hypothetical protein
MKTPSNPPSSQADSSFSPDAESTEFLDLLEAQQKIKSNRVPGVRSVLVVLSSRGICFDRESLKQKISMAYPEAAVFFKTTSGDAIGPEAPRPVDLLIDFTAPGSHQPWFYSRKLRSMSRVAIGRNAGFFRKSIYDKIWDEKALQSELPEERMAQERVIQQNVLALAGVAIFQMGDTPQDLSQTIALGLPPIRRLR